jgi:hypothetical protein
MEYKKAAQIRKKGLFELIVEKKFKEEKGLGASIAGAFSDKMKAKAKGYSEKFDRLNMVRALTGNGLIGKSITTLAGRAMGRSEDDIRYFGGFGSRKRKLKENKENKDPNFATIGSDEQASLQPGDSTADVLSKMLSFMTKTHELQKRERELEDVFKQEQTDEDNRRHKELVEAIKGYTKGNKSYVMDNNKSEETVGFFDGIKKWVMETFGDLLMLKELAKIGPSLIKGLIMFITALISGPGIALAGLLTLIVGGAKLLEWLNSKTPDMKVMSPTEAANTLKGGSEKDIETAGGREKLNKIITDSPTQAKEILDRNNEVEILAAGGKAKLDQIVKEGQIPVPTDAEMQGIKSADKIKPRPTTGGSALKSKQDAWDRDFGSRYNPDGTKKQGVEPAKTEKQGVEPAKTETTKPTAVLENPTNATPTGTPTPTAVKTSASTEASSTETSLNAPKVDMDNPDTKYLQKNTSNQETSDKIVADQANMNSNKGVNETNKLVPVEQATLKTIPEQIDPENSLGANEQIISQVNNKVNNIGGGEADVINTSSVRIRNEDLRRHFRPAVV